MEKEFDIVKIIRSLRNVKSFVNDSLMSKADKVRVKNGHKTTIDIDDLNEGSSSHTSGSSEEEKQNYLDNKVFPEIRRLVDDQLQA